MKPAGFLISEVIPLDIGVGRDLIYDKLRIHDKEEGEKALNDQAPHASHCP